MALGVIPDLPLNLPEPQHAVVTSLNLARQSKIL
jgi:hypothetical protein